MALEFWNKRYAENDMVYGFEPNKFFKLFIDLHKPGKILLPGEGEGRNAVYAAKKGWQVTAFDFSEVAREKALNLAMAEQVHINYEVLDLNEFRASVEYDAVALIYVHMPPVNRRKIHVEIYKSIKPGGFLVLEAFAKEQLGLASGGPQDEELLYDAPSLCDDFKLLHIMNCEQKEIQLQEGLFHRGQASVLRLTGQKI